MDNVITADLILENIAEPISQKEKKDFLSLALSKKVSQTDRLPRPETVLFLEHLDPHYWLFHKGSISAMSGKAKVGKTTAMALLIASALRRGLRVLWIDTEQGAYYANTTQYYLLKVAGLPSCDNLEMYDFREFGPLDRIELTRSLLAAYQYDLVVVDGVRDLIFDINNPTEATNITTEIMKWSVDYNCHVTMIIHENKVGGELRGHLGSECENKSEIVLSLTQSKDTVPIIIVSCKAVRGRRKFDDFYIARDSDGLPYIDGDSSPAYPVLSTDRVPKRIPFMEMQEYPTSFFNRLLNKVFAKPDEYNATTFKDQLTYEWKSAWGEHFDSKDTPGIRKSINTALAKNVLKHLLEAKIVVKKPGKKAGEFFIELNTDL